MKEKGVTKIALILLVLVCVFAIVACSDNVNTDGVVYVSYDTYAVVTGYIGTESDVKIAAFYKDLPVICIGEYAFKGCRWLTSVTIPDSVTSIGNYAFDGCSRLTSVTIPDSVTSIGMEAFYGCSSLQYNTYDNAYYLGSENNKYLYLMGVNPSNISTIHNSCKVIADGAFSNCSSLTSVTIPDSVTSIGEWAFFHCTALTSVTIGNNVTSIDDFAFEGCTSLKTVYYKGTAADWRKIIIGSNIIGNNNSNITNTKRYYYSESKPTGSGNYWHYVDGKPTVWPSDE